MEYVLERSSEEKEELERQRKNDFMNYNSKKEAGMDWSHSQKKWPFEDGDRQKTGNKSLG